MRQLTYTRHAYLRDLRKESAVVQGIARFCELSALKVTCTVLLRLM